MEDRSEEGAVGVVQRFVGDQKPLMCGAQALFIRLALTQAMLTVRRPTQPPSCHSGKPMVKHAWVRVMAWKKGTILRCEIEMLKLMDDRKRIGVL